jgi:hypothetical protein
MSRLELVERELSAAQARIAELEQGCRSWMYAHGVMMDEKKAALAERDALKAELEVMRGKA